MGVRSRNLERNTLDGIRITCYTSFVASVAQLVEQLTLNQLVEGSNPSGGTKVETGTWAKTRVPFSMPFYAPLYTLCTLRINTLPRKSVNYGK